MTHKQLIQDRIIEAVISVNQAAKKMLPDEKDSLNILIVVGKSKKICDWLQGYLSISVTGVIADFIIKLPESSKIA